MPVSPRATFDNPYGPQVTFRTEDVLPPAAYYISPEDRITVWVLTDLLAQTIYLQLRLLMPTGIIQLIPYQFSPTSTLTWYVGFEVPPWEGYLLGALCGSNAPQRGQCFVSVQVMRSAPPNLTQGGIVLLQGYVNNLNVLSYPTSPLEAAFSGRGALLTILPTVPLGGNLLLTAPANTMWQVRSCTFGFNTSAAAGNRIVMMTVNDANTYMLGFWASSLSQGPSSDYNYSFSCGGANAVLPADCTIAGPTDLIIPMNGSFRTYVQGLSATDQMTNFAVLVEEWMGA